MKSELVSILQNASWPALLVDSATNIRRANQAALRLFGPALEGNSPMLATVWGTDGGQTPREFLAGWEAAPAAAVSIKFRTKGGVIRSFPTAVCSATVEEQKFFLLQFLPENAGASPGKTPATEETQAMKQKLDCALQLARTVALDFNNALTSILGHASLVLSQMAPDNPWRGSLQEVEKSATKAAEIAADLGTFSRQEREGRTQAAGNLNVTLQRVVANFRQNPAAARIEWTLQLEKGLFAVAFDEPKLQQAFGKIIENALQSMTEGGRISVQSANVELPEAKLDETAHLAPGSYVRSEITDTGCGITPELLPRIFEPFFTTKGRNHRGLGLAWVYGIVTNHGGKVAVSSKPGVGTSVRIYLPADKRIIKEDAQPAGDLRGTQTILMVDDEDLLLTMGRTILTSYGYTVLTANTGQRALEVLARPESGVDLVITDMVMPGMSGRELVERIHEKKPGLPVLRTSGYVWGAGQQPDNGYLQKPFTARELLSRIKRLLEARQLPPGNSHPGSGGGDVSPKRPPADGS